MLFAILLYFIGLPLLDLNGSDEPREAGLGVGMVLSGDLVVPSLNGHGFLEKPPLFYWLQTISYQIFGVTTLAARLPAVLSALGGIAIVFWMAAAMGFSPLSAFLSGMILALAPQYWSAGRTCMLDITLTALIAAAIYCFLRCARADSGKDRVNWMLLFAGAAAAAILTKGLVSLAMIGVTLAGWLFFLALLRRKLLRRNWLMLIAGSLLALVPFAGWVYLVYADLGSIGLDCIWTNNVSRFTGHYAEHVEPFYYYFTKGEIFQPWILLVPFALYWHARRLQTGRGSAHLLLLCWSVIPFLLLMIAAGKRIVYLLPENPAWALLAGTFLAAVLEGRVSQVRRLRPLRWLAWAATGLGPLLFLASVGMPFAAKYLHLSLKSLLPLALISLTLAALMIYFERRKYYESFFIVLLLQIVMVFGLVNYLVAGYQNRKSSAKALFTAAAWKIFGEGKELILLQPTEAIEGNTVFYLRQIVRKFDSPEDLQKILSGKYGNRYVVIAHQDQTLPDTTVLSVVKIRRDTYVLLEHNDKP